LSGSDDRGVTLNAVIDVSRAKAIRGYMAHEELKWLAERALESRVIIEVGCWQGRSTRALADHCPGVIYSIDPWEGPYLNEDGSIHKINTSVFEIFQSNLADHVESGRVVPVRQTSQSAWSYLADTIGETVDLVFLDGDHRYDTVVAEIESYRLLLKPGGILAGHDYGHDDWPGVQRAVDLSYPNAEHCRSIWWVRL
jgi:predicted O-methyltransferase YrrM